MSDAEIIRRAIHDGRARQVGVTTALVHLALQRGATYIAMNDSHRNHLRRQYPGLKVECIWNVPGIRGPIVFDHHLVEHAMIEEFHRMEPIVTGTPRGLAWDSPSINRDHILDHVASDFVQIKDIYKGRITLRDSVL